jgi:hypothetical protein
VLATLSFGRPGPLTRGKIIFWFTSGGLLVRSWLNQMLFRRRARPRLGGRVFGRTGGLLVRWWCYVLLREVVAVGHAYIRYGPDAAPLFGRYRWGFCDQNRRCVVGRISLVTSITPPGRRC